MLRYILTRGLALGLAFALAVMIMECGRSSGHQEISDAGWRYILTVALNEERAKSAAHLEGWSRTYAAWEALQCRANYTLVDNVSLRIGRSQIPWQGGVWVEWGVGYDGRSFYSNVGPVRLVTADGHCVQIRP